MIVGNIGVSISIKLKKHNTKIVNTNLLYIIINDLLLYIEDKWINIKHIHFLKLLYLLIDY